MKNASEIQYAKDLLSLVLFDKSLPIRVHPDEVVPTKAMLCVLDWMLDGEQADKFQAVVDKFRTELERKGCKLTRLPAPIDKRNMNHG